MRGCAVGSETATEPDFRGLWRISSQACSGHCREVRHGFATASGAGTVLACRQVRRWVTGSLGGVWVRGVGSQGSRAGTSVHGRRASLNATARWSPVGRVGFCHGWHGSAVRSSPRVRPGHRVLPGPVGDQGELAIFEVRPARPHLVASGRTHRTTLHAGLCGLCSPGAHRQCEGYDGDPPTGRSKPRGSC